MTSKITPSKIEELSYCSFVDDNAYFVLTDALQTIGDKFGEYLVSDADLNEKKRKISHRLFHIEDLDDTRFRLHNIYLDGKLHIVDQGKELLDNGHNHTQDQWVEWLKSDANEDKWHLASGPLYHASLAALHYNQDHADEEQRNLIKQCREMHAQDFKKHWMMTSTRIIYNSHGKDKMIHDYDSPQQKEIELDFVGPDGYITQKSNLEREMNALFGTSDLEEVEKVYSALTDEKPRLWRNNYKPRVEDQRALVLGVSNVITSFDVSAVSFIVRPGRGWSWRQKD
ncbi:MAG: hypothetical protein Q8R37_06020 [Nanoarchaeota archaeon]|nr:hypothetical protein [Nanoarchaeota archaeon]